MALTELQKQAIAVALDRRVPFVAYSLPLSPDVTFYADDSHVSSQASECFKIYPWLSGRSHVINRRLSASELIDRYATALTPLFQPLSPDAIPLHDSTPHELYIERVGELIERLKRRGGKTVYSRVKCGVFSSVDASVKAASRLFGSPSPNLSAVYYHPAVGAWMTATPEVLLSVDSSGGFTTMSLAGTRPAADNLQPWSEKNRQEQAIVTDYICRILGSLSISYNVGEVETIDAGPVQHLRTLISGRLGAVSPDAVASGLSPTPALGGYPVNPALADIEELETHPRRCYGGYLAIVAPDSYRAYVNLRCAQFDAYAYCLYAGGGITPHSTPADEWAETEIKLSRLLPLFHH